MLCGRMKTWIALLRGINVGGNNILPMKDLRALLSDLGYRNPQTYIQSGNCVFGSDDGSAATHQTRIADAINAQFGFSPQVFVLTLEALNDAIAANPYPQGYDNPKTVHLSFLAEPADVAGLETLEACRKDSEAYTLTPAVFYLYAPDGIGRSKLAAKVEKALGVAATGRNLRSAMKIAELAEASA